MQSQSTDHVEDQDRHQLAIEEIEGPISGPTVALIGGVHGDEDEGVLAVRRVLEMLDRDQLTGRIRGLAVANPLARAARARTSPEDGMNLARVFPGDQHGSPTEQIANEVVEQVISGSDLLIDLHSAGRDYAMPLFCGFRNTGDKVGRKSAEAAGVFGAPLVWAHEGGSPGRTLSVAQHLGIPAIYAECSGGVQIRGEELDAFVDGVLRVLRWFGVLTGATPEPVEGQRFILGGEGDIDGSPLVASTGGLLVTRTWAGEIVEAGTLLAEVYDTQGQLVERVSARDPGIVMFLRRRARIGAGDTVAMIAPSPVER